MPRILRHLGELFWLRSRQNAHQCRFREDGRSVLLAVDANGSAVPQAQQEATVAVLPILAQAAEKAKELVGCSQEAPRVLRVEDDLPFDRRVID